jgi:hypothetical protein
MGQVRGLSEDGKEMNRVIDFSKYHLRENPFPETAVIDPLSDDIRLNGGIFHEGIFKKEIESLKKKTEQGINVIYLAGIEFDRGIGKSALMINHMRHLRDRSSSTCAYVRCCEKEKPRDAIRKVVEQWHLCGYLWDAFKLAFANFSKAQNDPLLTYDAVEQLFRANPRMSEKLPLSLYTHVRDSEKTANYFASWAAANAKTSSAGLAILARDYLSSPLSFIDSIKGKAVDPISLYEECSKFLNVFGYARHYVFLDQFEDIVMGTSKANMSKFALEMKSIVRASPGMVSIFVTLHPNSEMSLRLPAAQDMTGVAPLDAVHRIDVMVLDTRGDSAISLAEEYFKFFRIGEPPYATYPIEPELLEFVCYLNRGLIRGFLQQLHNILDYGASNGYSELTFEYAKKHPLEVLGKEVDQRMIDGFNKHKGKPVAESDSSRSMSKLIRDFKQSEQKP